MEKGLPEGAWVVVVTPSKEYVGCVVEPAMVNNEAILASEWLTLKPAFEFVAPIVPTPQGQLQRLSMLVSLGACLEPVPLHTKFGTIFFFDEMTEGDRASYERMIAETVAFTEEARVKRLGLTLPGAPKGARRA